MAGGEQSCWGAALLEAHPTLSPSQAPPPHPCILMPRAHLWAAGGRWVQDRKVLTKVPPCVRASRGGQG